VKESDEVKTIFPDEAKAFIDSNEEGTFTLLDVRQPFEYEEAHLAGAKLIPLPQLADSLQELDRHQPILIYCAVGGRSAMAARLLSHHEFENVYHIQGGINAWEETTASGPVAFHLRFVKGDEPPQEMICIAYQMEEGLRRFHQEVESRTLDVDLRDLLNRLIHAEENHKRRLLDLLEAVSKGDPEAISNVVRPPLSEKDLMEGGIDISEFMHNNDRYLQSVSGYLELAMMIETQALDLYLRMANSSANPLTRQVLFRIGDEEKAHLAMLAQYLERRGQSNTARATGVI
jgi:sulfur-carrier protein adenylyltransferase/sulfurtransferase